MAKQKFNKGEIVIYKPKGQDVELRVKLEKETVWLTQAQIALLFGTKRPAITKHLNNIFESKELDKDSVCSILEHTATDGKVYKTQFYNLYQIRLITYIQCHSRESGNLLNRFRIKCGMTK